MARASSAASLPSPARPGARSNAGRGSGLRQPVRAKQEGGGRRRCGFPASPTLPSPAASALHSHAPAYPQLLEIRHFIPPAGAAAAAATAPPPAAANDTAATTAAAAASSTILHWEPLKTPRPPPPPPPLPPGPSRDSRRSSAPGERGPAPRRPALPAGRFPPASSASARGLRLWPSLSPRPLPPSAHLPHAFRRPALLLCSPQPAGASSPRRGGPVPEASSRLQRYPRDWRRAWAGGGTERKKRWPGLVTGTFTVPFPTVAVDGGSTHK